MEKDSRRGIWRRYWSDRQRFLFSSIDLDVNKGVVDFFHEHLKGAKRVLDIGVGGGGLADKLKQKNPGMKLVGVDIAIPERRLESASFVSGEAERLPFLDSSFDAAYSSLTLSHTDMDKSARELLRILKPGARAVLLLHKKGSLLHSQVKMKCDQIRIISDEFRKEAMNYEWVRNKLADLDGELALNRPLLDSLEKAFSSEAEAKSFFEARGFAVEESKLFKDGSGSADLGIGLILRKAKQ
ncbi:MAG: methyltransferase domain-containing protein [Candidatus Diapherotrites archaeon]|nr:methyltransferase domain-containing protein [Candidatus Diapherotrites archaeon]